MPVSETQTFLDAYIRQVFADFERSAWCDTNDFQFNSGVYPSLVNQQRYILKYFPAYFCEYYFAYGDFLRRFAARRQQAGGALRVISIGCGPGTDFFALERLIADNGVRVPLRYLGVDIVEWAYRPTSPDFRFLKTDFAQLPDDELNQVDLIVFPKSLTELDPAGLAKFGRQIAATHRVGPVYFLNSYITENSGDPSSVKGLDRFTHVSAALEAAGFATPDKLASYTYLTNHTAGLRANFDFFVIPDFLVSSVSSLKSRCSQRHSANPNCSFCNVDFWPILRSHYIAYNILEFARH